MTDCLFCKIVAGDIPASKIYEDDDVFAFLDISQTTTGHTLLIPKNHYRNILDMTDTSAGQLFAYLPKVAKGLQKATKAKGINIVNNNESCAGQTVFHTHIHLIPRFDNSDEFDIQFTEHEPNFEQLNQLAKTIASEVSNED